MIAVHVLGILMVFLIGVKAGHAWALLSMLRELNDTGEKP